MVKAIEPAAITFDQGAYQYVGPAGNFAPAYDLDGNLLSDGRWTYTWDGENRLVKMVSAAWTQPGGGYQSPDGNSVPVVTLEFAYDGLSRRVKNAIACGQGTCREEIFCLSDSVLTHFRIARR